MHRPVVMGKRGMVSFAHYLVSQAGLLVLRDGGSAMEAAITVNAVLNVVQPYACGIGGSGDDPGVLGASGSLDG